METVNKAGVQAQNGTMLFESAYERLHSEMQTLGEDEILTVNLDIPSAVTTVLGIQPELDALEPRISKQADCDVERVLNVGLYARALAQAHSLYIMALEPSDTLKTVVEEGTALRDVLIADAHALARRKLINAERLKELTGPLGYKNLAFDLQHLGNLFTAQFPSIEGKWALQEADIVRAKEIATKIIEIVGQREQAAARIAEAADIRNRAFTLFMRAYDEVRRVVTFLRWHKDDVGDIAPSLYTGKTRRKERQEAVLAPVVAPPAGDHVDPTTDMPATTATTAPPAPATSTAKPAPVSQSFLPARGEIGTPNSSPFLS